MPKLNLGRALAIANPAAHGGRGAAAAEHLRRFFASYSSATTFYEHRLTAAQGDGERAARESAGYDTVIALGGDGIIHEVANGLMQIRRDERPALAIIPFGSGNDFARTLGVPFNDVEAALARLAASEKHAIDVGGVNGIHFLETLSFGLDAAIALDTTDKRTRGTDEAGEQLYVTSGIKYIVSGSKGYACTFSLDGGPKQHIRSLIFAIQNGPTYGGGFTICPHADPGDGLLDICYNVKIPSVPHTLLLFALARFGKHTGSSVLAFAQAAHIEIEYDEDSVPCQADGEEIIGRRFTVDLLPSELNIYR